MAAPPPREIKYQPLSPTELEALTSHSSKSDSLSRAATTIMPLILIAIALTLGWIAGQHFSDTKRDGLISPPGNVERVWEHNLTFSQRPTPESEAAWNSLIPVGRGFVHHPELAPFISNLAVFHQLHCLHAIVVSYYTAVEEAEVARGQQPDEFLRETLMCSSDTNLEGLDHETRTTSGWGQIRQCRDYQKVVKWAETWANSTDTGILT